MREAKHSLRSYPRSVQFQGPARGDLKFTDELIHALRSESSISALAHTDIYVARQLPVQQPIRMVLGV